MNPKQQMIDEIARIEGLPRRQKWKAAQLFTLKVNKTAREDHRVITKEVNEARKELNNAFASGKDGLRWGMRIPESVLLALELFDPELKESVKKDKMAQKKELKQLMSVFPEYSLPRRI